MQYMNLKVDRMRPSFIRKVRLYVEENKFFQFLRPRFPAVKGSQGLLQYASRYCLLYIILLYSMYNYCKLRVNVDNESDLRESGPGSNLP